MNKTVFLIMLMLSLILTACGGSKSSPTTDLDVTMTDFQFSPNQFTVPAGQEITLSANNNGGVVHNFVIMQKGTSAGTEFTDEDLPNVYWQVEVEPGGSTKTTFVAPSDPGDYEVVCKTPGHVQAGMIAKLIVVTDDQK
ncbi:MAG: cupredoxin domain-containing protein [Byssovorax cruenta]|jgi:uncharacterized cupredoxin-like copper-binding protein